MGPSSVQSGPPTATMGHRRAWRILLLDALLASRSIATLDFVALPAVPAIRPGAVVGRCQWPATAIAVRRGVSAGRVAAPTPVLRARRSPVATPSSVAVPEVCAVKVAAPSHPPRLQPSHPGITTSRSAFQARSTFPARRSVRFPSVNWQHSSRQCRAPSANSSPLAAHKGVPSVLGRRLPQEEG